MIILAFFFILRAGEYTGTKYDSTPFCLSDLTFSVGRTVFDTATATENELVTATDNELAAATFVILTFSTQKNGVRCVKIGHGASGDPLLCPKKALRRRVTHIRQQDAPADTPLSCFTSP